MSNRKIKTIIECPLTIRAGYGEWSQDIMDCIIENERLDIGIVPTGWGCCPPTSTENLSKWDKYMVKQSNIDRPELFISITLPHLSKAVGHKNINISAGVEVDFATNEIMTGINRHDMNIALSNFTKQTYLNSPIKPTKPIEVVGWHKDYRKPVASKLVDDEMNKIIEKEVFLYVGQMTHGDLFLDRKNIGTLIRLFTETFSNENNKPALVIKSSGGNYGYVDRNCCMEKIQSCKMMSGIHPNNQPNIYIMHGEMTPSEMNYLYNHEKVIGHVSATKGEGWGMPLFYGSLTGKPVICPNYSGQLDFLKHSDNEELFIPLNGKLCEIPQQAVSEFFPAKSKWYHIYIEEAKRKLREYYYGDRTLILEKAKKLATLNKEKFTHTKMSYKINKLINKIV